MDKKSRNKGNRVVKDLPARKGQDVKGGLTSSVLKKKDDTSSATIGKI